MPGEALPSLSRDVVVAIERLASDFGVTNLRVFGSVARGTAAPSSDVDLLVDYPADRGGFAFVSFCDALSALLERPVDVVTERSLPPSVRRDVIAEATPHRDIIEE
mgnify:CR=1 FL=1